ncbi:MAG TPA: PAS domain S-box protein, partial [Candidatus Limnocylindria bacterium]
MRLEPDTTMGPELDTAPPHEDATPDAGTVRLTGLALLVIVLAGGAAGLLPADMRGAGAQLLTMLGAIASGAILARGWRTSSGADRAFRANALAACAVWVGLHVLRTLALTGGAPIPAALDWALLGIVGVLIARCWPLMLRDRFPRAQATAIALDSAAVFVTLAAVTLMIVGGPVTAPVAQAAAFIGLAGGIGVLYLALTPPRGLHGWLAALVGLVVFGLAQAWGLLAEADSWPVAPTVALIGQILATYGAATGTGAVDADARFQRLASRTRGVLPIAAAGLAPGLVVVNELGGGGQMSLIIDVMVGVVLAIVVARQTILLGERDAIAREATEAAGREREAVIDLRASEQRFQALLKHSSDVFLILGMDGTVRYQSPAVEQVLGYAPEERIGNSIFELTHPDDIGFVQAAIGEIMSVPGATKTVELRSRHADGSWRTLEATGWNLVEDPVVAGIVVNYRDITERKALERQLIHDAFHDPLTGLA